MLIGVTGGMGAGKSALCRFFTDWGGYVVDADGLGHQILQRESVIDDLRAAFGADILREDGSVDRGELGRRAFASAAAWGELQGIVRPVVESLLWDTVTRACATHSLVIVDAALIFEWGIEQRFQCLMVVIAAEATRIRRVRMRSGLPEEEVRQRMARQWPPERACAKAHYVIRNDGDLPALRIAARRAWEFLTICRQRGDA